uniref:Uncharacterized protein n=1 Tax=Picea glauca TaxID=3330 RepID=A0A101M2E4_PICGL|nr:hypothetical protein ABT39_MTgene2845 [Picea glauca]QHR87621.1 hypothetical protein Q903MT_gene1633 [Picea sitchensis]
MNKVGRRTCHLFTSIGSWMISCRLAYLSRFRRERGLRNEGICLHTLWMDEKA